MKRILQLADLHLSETATIAGAVHVDANGANLAVADTLHAVERIVAAARAAGPLDGIVIAGDLFDHARPTPNELRIAAALCDYLGGCCLVGRVLMIPGNHDLPRNPGEASALVSLAWHPRVMLVEEPRVVEYAGVKVACLPYPRRSAAREYLGAEVEGQEIGILSAALTTLAIGMAAQGADVLLGHATIGGATVGAQPRAIEGDIEIGREALAQFSAVMLGHIHKQQPGYSGSPTVQDFGEEGEAKGGILHTRDDAGTWTRTPINVQGRTWRTIDVIAGTDPTAHHLDNLTPGGVYRIRGDLPADTLSVVRDQLAVATAAGAYVQDELRVAAENRARDTEIGREGIDETEILTRAMSSLSVPKTDHARILGVHKHVQMGGAA
jgi:DNA repair exonuclease SbcCD nuclease subunit